LFSPRVCCLTICIASATEIIFSFVPFMLLCGYLFVRLCGQKPKGRFRTGLSRLAEAFSLLLVTVLTPATTFTVERDCSQNCRAVNSSAVEINYFNYCRPSW